MDSLALVAHELAVTDDILRWAAGRNLEHVHAGCEQCAAMVLMSRGSKEFKLECLRDWLGNYRVSQYEREYLEKMAREELAPNYFLYSFLRQQTYILHRFLECARLPPSQVDPALFEMRPQVCLAERVKAHPMMQSHLQITST